MDVTFPPGFPILTGDVLEINRFLAYPLFIQRALNTATQQRFISDAIFTGRGTPTGGAILYEQAESIFADEPVESIAPGGDYPVSTISRGPAKIAAVQKWGEDAKVTLESIQRERMSPVDRALTKLSNSVIRQVDQNALSILLNPVVTPAQTLAGSSWAAAGDAATIVSQLMTAIGLINAPNLGYKPDTLVINDMSYADMIASERISNMMRRESADNPIYTGTMANLLGLDIMVTNNVPGFSDTVASGARQAIVLDRKMMGGMGDEVPLTTATWWIPDTEQWRLRAKRQTTPWVSEPGAVCVISGI